MLQQLQKTSAPSSTTARRSTQVIAATAAQTKSPPPARPAKPGLRFRNVVVWGLVAIAVLWVITRIPTGSSSTPATKPAATVAQQLVAPAAPLVNPDIEKCRAEKAQLKVAYDQKVHKKEYWPAAGVVRKCANITGDSEFKQMVAEAELDDYWKSARDKALSPRDRELALDKMEREFPKESQEQATTVKQLRAQVSADLKALEKKEAAQLAAEKRKKGVSIGMTQADVLASSWGRPESINKSHYASGTHEQWVYGSGSYLYFENGILSSIQN
jgi:hypothetical protein